MNIVPKKLIRHKVIKDLKVGEWEFIEDKNELNKLYALKIREELAEIQKSEHKDIMEFVDLIQAVFSFSKQNGFTYEQISAAIIEKSLEKGYFTNIALNK
jgi:predicted house-cleaning noncanonical NTP pyrophosphatase (MazG superfamily)